MSGKIYFIYTRVSDQRYMDSLGTQVNILKGHAKRNHCKYTTDTIIAEKDSGNKGKRPEFVKMIEVLEKDSKKHESKREYAGILFYKIDRLFRNFDDFHRVENLMNSGYRFISGTETIENTPTGRLLFRMLAGFAIYESEKLSSRESLSYLVNSLKHKFDSLGGIRPFGYMVQNNKEGWRRLVKNDEESKIINLIYTMKASDPKISSKRILAGIQDIPVIWNILQEVILERDKKRRKSKEEGLLQKIELKKTTQSSDQKKEEDEEEEKNIKDEDFEIEELYEEEYNKHRTMETRATEIINKCLKNEWVHKYHWLITRTFQINDELIQNFLKNISAYDEDRFVNEFWDNDTSWDESEYSIGSEITFTFYSSDMAIIDDAKYKKVQASFKARAPKKTDGEIWFLAVLDGILYLRTPESELLQMNYYQTAKKTIWYRRNFNKKTIEKSEWVIEKAIRKSHLFENHKNTRQYRDKIFQSLEIANRSTLVKQLRSENMKNVFYDRQIHSSTETMKDFLNSPDPNRKKKVFKALRQEIIHYTDLRRETERNIENLEKSGRDQITFFFHLITGNISLTDRSERRYAYLAMFERIEMPIDGKSITIHLRQYMAQILWVPKEYTISLM